MDREWRPAGARKKGVLMVERKTAEWAPATFFSLFFILKGRRQSCCIK